MIAWDTETRSLRWWENPAFLASWSTDPSDEAGQVMTIGHSDKADPQAFRSILERDNHHVGANMKFDAHQMREASGFDILARGSGIIADDVLMMSRLWFGARRSSHGLKDLSVDVLGVSKDDEDAMSRRYLELTGRADMKHDDAYYDVWVHWPELVETYAGLDAVRTRKLYDYLAPLIDADPKLAALYRMEREVQTVLYEAEKTGVHVDQDAVARLDAHYRDRDRQARADLERTLGFVPEGEGSKERLVEGLLAAGVELTERTEKNGDFAVNRKALQQIGRAHV